MLIESVVLDLMIFKYQFRFHITTRWIDPLLGTKLFNLG